ncbi:hypothetical protein [Shewanella violacea]|uniref:2',3'-cyclic-nucleotide 2'-phosphodiesterase n=1 Tax=Shewanella violacea (strain JCM 10179 / CIP 106290 / LMG 19151 / DSS12) TaxID=637905 RepID=D4ZLP6_SHEVD|nr:hypothetical protein [Shewanella violacea]BAJ02595.1 hypothetical protein SVI_2624 [Shewanella violacea DSS12]
MIKYRVPSQQIHHVIWALSFTIFIFTTFWSVLIVEYFDPDSYLWQQLEQATFVDTYSTAEGVVDHLLNAVLFSAFVSVIAYILLKYLSVRVSQGSLPEGFYTQSSWLDIENKYLVLIQADELVFFEFERRMAKRLQIKYQHDASVDDLIALADPKTVRRIPFDEISELVSDHNSDIFYVKHKDKRHRLVFLNQAVKAHALELVQLLLPEELEYHRNERTRFKAALPFLAVFIGLALLAMAIDIIVIRYFVGLLTLFLVMPKLCTNYLDPKVTEIWRKNEIRV